MKIVKSLVLRTVNALVLTTYMTSVLRIDYAWAAETTVTMEAPRSVPPVLHLRPLPDHGATQLDILNTDKKNVIFPPEFKLKVKRGEVSLHEGGLLESGVKIKLQRNEEEGGAPRKVTAFKLFMADTVPFSQGFMEQLNLVPQVDPELGVIGVRWKVQDFPDLSFLILRDASLVISGNHITNQSFKVSTSANIRLENLTANVLSLKAQSLDLKQKVSLNQAQIKLTTNQSKAVIEEGANVSIPQLSVRRGQLINQGTLRSLGHQNLDIHTGAVFENRSQVAADIKTSLSGNGLLLNRGRIVSPIVEGRIGTLESKGAIEANKIDVITTHNLLNAGLIHGREATLLTSVTGFIENTGKIVGELLYRLSAVGRIDNAGSIAGESGRLISLKEGVINQGTLVAAHIQANHLRNDQKGRILKAESIQVTQGENLGHLETDTLSVNQESFINRGHAFVKSLVGTGIFRNQGQLQFIGTAHQRAMLGIRSFTNLSELPEQAVVQGDYLTVSSLVHRFLLESGKWAIHDLLIEAGAKSALYRNKGEFLVANLILHQAGFDNYGQAFIEKLTGTIRSLENHGDLRVKKKVRLPQATVKNHGFLEFNQKATVRTVDNHKDFIAIKGLEVGEWINRGQAEIKKFFSVSSFKNFGEMRLANTTLKTDQLQFENQGTLFLIKTVFETAQGAALTLINHKTLSIEQGLQGVSALINQDLIELGSGSYSFGELENKQNSQIKLYGPLWTIAKSQPSEAETYIAADTLKNDGKISAEQTLIYDHPEAHQGIWEADKLVYKQPGKTLTPQSLVGLNTSHLEVETDHFDVTTATDLLISSLILRLSGRFLVAENFITKALEVYAKKDIQCGVKREDPTYLVTTEGPLTLHAPVINGHFGKIFGKGKTWLRAEGDTGSPQIPNIIQVGVPVAGEKIVSHLDVYRKKTNGAYVASDSDLIIQAAKILIYHGTVFGKGDVYLEEIPGVIPPSRFGERSKTMDSLNSMKHNDRGNTSAEEITLQVHQPLYNLSGKIESFKNIYVDCDYVAKAYGEKKEYKGQPNITADGGIEGSAEILWWLVEGGPATLQAGENIYFNRAWVNNQGSDILAGQSIFHQGKLVAGKGVPFKGSFRSNQLIVEYIHGSNPRVLPARVIAGQTLNINTGGIQLTGTTSAFVISFHANTLDSRHLGLKAQSRPTYDSHIFVDLVELSKQFYGPEGFIKALPDGRVTTDMPVTGGIVPTMQQRLYTSYDAPSTLPAFITDPLQKFMIDPLPFSLILQRAMAEQVGKLNIDGRSGHDLVRYLFQNAEELRQHYTSGRVTKKDLQQTRKALIAYDVRPVEEQLMLAATLVVPKEIINPFQDSGDINSDTTLEIQTTQKQTYVGNRVRGFKGITAQSQGTLKATSTTEFDRILGRQGFYAEEGPIALAGDKGVTLQASEIQAKEDITVQSADADIQELPLLLQTYVTELQETKKETIITTRLHHTIVPTTVATQGSIKYHLGNQAAKVRLEGAQNIAYQDIVFDGGQAEVSAALAYDTIETSSSRTKMFSKQWKYEYSKTPIATQALLLAAGKVHFTKNTTKATLTGAAVQVPTLINDTSEGLLVEPAIGLATYYSKQFQGNKRANVRITQDAGQEVMIPTVLNVDEIITTHSQLKLVSAKLLENTTIEGVYEQSVRHLRSWNNTTVQAKKIPAGVIAVVALATAIATGGAGATLAGTLGFTGTGASMFSAGFTALCSQVSSTLVATGGDLESTMKSVASRKTLMSLATSMVTAGALNELGISAPTGEKATLGNVAQYAVSKAAVEATVNVALGQQSFEEALKSAGLSLLMTTASVYGASQIGKAYSSFNADGSLKLDGEAISPVTHKVLHGLLGAAIGAVRGDAIAGAIGGMTSECLADLLKEDAEVVSARVAQKAQEQGIDLQSPQFETLVRQEIQSTVDWSRMGAAVATLLAGRDVTIAIEVATNALENNFLPLVILAVGSMMIANADAPDFSKEHKQAEEAEETCVRAERELEDLLVKWSELKKEKNLLERGRYRPSSGGTASAAKDASGLFFDSATRDKRIKNIQADKATHNKVGRLLVEHYNGRTTLDQLSQKPHLMLNPAPRRLDIIERAEQVLARYSQPSLDSAFRLAGVSSNSLTPSLMMMGLATAATTQGMGQRLAAAATSGGQRSTFGGAGLRGLGGAPKNPGFLVAVAAGVGTAYLADQGYGVYKRDQEAAEDRAAAHREDLGQSYGALHASQGQSWLQQTTQALARKDQSIPSAYNPRTDKGKEKLAGSDISRCEAPAENLRWVDQGVGTQPAEVKTLSTPIPEPARPIIEGFDPSPLPIDRTLEGFDLPQLPEVTVFTNDRKTNCSKGESEIWESFGNYKKGIKTNGLHGRKKEYYKWDYTHNDIEVYNFKKEHKGSMDPHTGEIYKAPVKGRDIKKE